MKIVDLEQGSPEWLSWKSTHITATDIPVIMDSSPWSYPEQLWRRKKGIEEYPAINDDMRRGMDLEDEARAAVQFQLGMEFDPIVVESEFEHWAGASLDGYNATAEAVLEIKCPRATGFKKAVGGFIPWAYLYQMYWQMYCTSAKTCYYAVYFEGDVHLIQLPPAKEDSKLWQTYSTLMRETPMIHQKALRFYQQLACDVFAV